MQRKQLTLVIVSLLVVVLSVSLAYFTAQIIGKEKNVDVSSANLQIVFTDSDGAISGSNIEPGWSDTKTITVENNSKSEYKYNIVIKDLLNTFVTEGYLQYKITSTNNGYNMTEFKDIPKSSAPKDTILAYSVVIPNGVTQSYTIEFKYANDESVDQSDDMGKKLSGTLFITEGTEQPTLLTQILNDNPTRETRNTYDTIFTTTNTGTLYKATESIANSSSKDVYYFAGDAKNNWVKFAGFYWRIIRTNADASIRLLYSGTSPDTTSGYIGKSAFNSTSNDSMYVGYMYGTSGSQANNRTNKNDSTIKGVIDTWYSNNLSSYAKYLSTEAVYCNDREVGSGTYSATGSGFEYAAWPRLNAGNPTYNCANIEDAFSGSNSEAKLIYPIGLMTADEITYAGGYKYTNLPSPYAWYYLNSVGESITGTQWWWLLSPDRWDGYDSQVWHVFGSYRPGYLGHGNVNSSGGVRPAISLKTCTLWISGDGSASDPYTIKETTSGC